VAKGAGAADADASVAKLERTLDRVIETLTKNADKRETRQLLIEARRLRSVVANWRSIPPSAAMRDEMSDRVLTLTATVGAVVPEAAPPELRKSGSADEATETYPLDIVRDFASSQFSLEDDAPQITASESDTGEDTSTYQLDFEPHLYSLETNANRQAAPQPAPDARGLRPDKPGYAPEPPVKPRAAALGAQASAVPSKGPAGAGPAARQPQYYVYDEDSIGDGPVSLEEQPAYMRVGALPAIEAPRQRLQSSHDLVRDQPAPPPVAPAPPPPRAPMPSSHDLTRDRQSYLPEPPRGRAPMPSTSNERPSPEPSRTPSIPPPSILEEPRARTPSIPPPSILEEPRGRTRSSPPPAPPATYEEAYSHTDAGDYQVPRTQINVLAVKLKEPVDPLLVLLAEPYSGRADAYRAMRRKLVAGANPTVIGVTSAGPAEGKTSFAANFALTLREGARGRVLLIEANLGAPRLTTLLGFDTPACFIEQLGRHVEDPRAPWTVAEPLPKLNVLAIDPNVKHDPLLDPVAFSMGAERLKQAGYEYIVIDCPPVIGSVNANVIADACDGMILTALPMISKRREMRKAVEQLDPAPILGAVVLEV
jgi:Mrp family chromosome partitioning ATPase